LPKPPGVKVVQPPSNPPAITGQTLMVGSKPTV
jgi:hypothetical protein